MATYNSYPVNDFHKERINSILVIVLCLFTFFVNNAALPSDIMEERNLVTAREIVAEGNWLVPTMNGELRLEKPPLPTWIAAAIEVVAPDNLTVQRSAAGIMGTIWVIFLFLFAKFISGKDSYALTSVIIFITCYNIVTMGRSATWDIYCHAFMMGAIYFLARGLLDTSPSASKHWLKWFSLSGILMGLSFLSKGPVSFYALLLPFLIAAIGVGRPRMKGKWKYVALMIVLCLAISTWWYVYLMFFHHNAAVTAVNQESGAWANHNVRPWWYYWRFFAETGVWALLLLSALALPFWKKRVTIKSSYLISFVWTLSALVLLSLMPEKKMRYLLPMMAPCALLVASIYLYICKSPKSDKPTRIIFLANGIIVSLIVCAIPWVGFFSSMRSLLPQGAWYAVIPALSLIGILLFTATFAHRPKLFLGGIMLVFLFTESFLLKPVGQAFGNPDRKSINQVQQISQLKNLPFYHSTTEPMRIELVYEAHHKILPLQMDDSTTLLKALPCVLVSQKSVGGLIPTHLLQKIDTQRVGTYDDNMHPKNNSHYTDIFVNHVTILRAKAQ